MVTLSYFERREERASVREGIAADCVTGNVQERILGIKICESHAPSCLSWEGKEWVGSGGQADAVSTTFDAAPFAKENN
jgi:hypothetical protein